MTLTRSGQPRSPRRSGRTASATTSCCSWRTSAVGNATDPREIGARLLAVAGAALLVAGFFLPWLDGTGEFGAREFSGADLARLVRNFEIVASSSSEAKPLRVTAIVLYAVPALAVNAAVIGLTPADRAVRASAAFVAAAYGLGALTATVVLAGVSWTDLDGVLGAPMVGWWASFVGAAALAGATGVLALWRHDEVGDGLRRA